MAKRLKKTRAKVNIPICLAGVLLCLALFSIRMAGGVYARYTVTESSSDYARVIKFGDIALIKAGADKQHILPGGNLTWGASVSFEGSEAATYLFMEVIPTGGWIVSEDGMAYTPFASGPSWTVNHTWKFHGIDNGAYIYYLSLSPKTTLAAYPLFVGNTVAISEDLTEEALHSLSTVSVDFRASVVQSGGFASVDAAWASLAAQP